MKKSVVLFLATLSVFVAIQSSNANVIATWTFESSVPTTAGPFSPEVGSGSALGFHAGASAYSNPQGNGSTESFSSTVWAVGDYYQFSVSSIGLSGIKISFDQTSSSTGPGTFGLFYSIDGISYSQFGANYNVLQNGLTPNAAWGSTYLSAYSFSFDLNSITALENDSSIFFRLVDQNALTPTGGTVASGGTDRVDNFSVTGTPFSTPEQTSTPALAAIVVFSCLAFGRRAQRLA